MLIAQVSRPELPWPLVVAIVVATTVMIVLTRRRTSRLTLSPRGHARRQRAEAERQGSVEDELRAVIIELESLARQVNAQIETKYRKLEAVIADADRRIAQLEALTADLSDRSDDLSDRSLQPIPASGLDEIVGDDPATTPVGPHRPGDTPGLDRQAVLAMAEAGKAPLDIAQQLGRPAEEIELMLAVQRETSGKKRPQPGPGV